MKTFTGVILLLLLFRLNLFAGVSFLESSSEISVEGLNEGFYRLQVFSEDTTLTEFFYFDDAALIFSFGEEGSYALYDINGNLLEEGDFSSSEENLALFKPVSGSFNRFPESLFIDESTSVLTRVNDGKISWYDGMAVSGELTSAVQQIFLDLGSLQSFSEVFVTWSKNRYPLDYDLIYSTDGENWERISRSADDFFFSVAEDNSPLATDKIQTNLSARYVGIWIEENTEVISRLPGRTTVALMEIEVYE